MEPSFVVALSIFVLMITASSVFQLIIILDFRSTLKKRSAFYEAVGSPESTGTWKTLSYWYVGVIALVTCVTGALFFFQPHLY